MAKIELPSYAKINLTLEVSPPRGDGYHDIDSVVQLIDLADELSILQAPQGVIEATADCNGVPSGPENLVYRACKAFFDATGVSGGAICSIKKTIPAQAGLGGGSGNAATAILGLDRLYGTGLDQTQLVKIAAGVGSDVPLFICSGTVRMRGRGDAVQSLPDAPGLFVVVIKPKRGVSTAWAYSQLDEKGTFSSGGASDAAEEAIKQGDSDALVGAIVNDFDPVVCASFPEIEAAKQFLLDVGARSAMLCGSGSAVFGVFNSQVEADMAAERARAAAAPFTIFSCPFVTRTS